MANEPLKRKKDGTLTDYGKSLERTKNVASQLSKLGEAKDYAGDSYQRYQAENRDLGNAPQSIMSEEMFNASKNKNSSGNGGGNSGGTSVPSLPFNNIAEQLAKASANRKISQLQKVRDKNLGVISQEKKEVPEIFKGLRTGEKTRSQMAVERFRKMRETQGLSGSGATGQDTIAENVVTRGRLGELDKGQATALTDLARRETDIRTGFESDSASIRAGEEASALQRQLDEQRYQQGIAREDKLIADRIARENQLNEQQIARQDEALARAEAQGVTERERTDFLNTITQFQGDFQAEIDNVINNNDDTDDWKIPFLRTARQQKIANIQQQEATQQQSEQEALINLQNDQYDRAFKTWTELGTATPEIAQILGVPQGSKTNDASYREAQLALANRKENRIGSGSGGNTTTDNFKRLANGLKQATDAIDTKQQVPDGYGGFTTTNIPAFKQESQRQQMGGTYIAKAYLNGSIDEAMAEKLSQQEGIDEDSVLTAIKVIQGTENIGGAIRGLFGQD